MSDIPPPVPPASSEPPASPEQPAPSAPVAPAPASSAPASEAAPKPHVLAWIALGAAAVGFIFACIPGALIVGWILLPIAFVLAIVALFLKGKKWPAITALILAIVGTIVAIVVFVSVVAAAFQDSFGSSDTNSGSSSESSESVPAESAAAEEPASEGDYVVTINGATQTTDYDGKPALIVDFTFTNNGTDDANFMFATSAKAFQDGVELETALIMDDSFDSANALKDIKQGTSLDVQMAYVLDGTSDVLVEVTELLSFDDTPIASKTFTVQ